MTSVEPSPPEEHRRKPVHRRHVLRYASGAGLLAMFGGLSYWNRPETVTPPSSGNRPSLAATTSPETSTVLSPSPASVVPPVPTPPLASGEMLCREAWHALPPTGAGTRHTISRMTLHHTGAVLGDSRNAPARLLQHQRLHQNERGWIDIAYHIGVDRNGDIFELRDYNLVGDTATDYDPTGHFLVLCEGDFDQEVVTEAQLDGAALAFAWAAQTFSVTTDTLAGHRNFAATSCPGADLYAHLATGDLQRRIDNLLAAGTVDLRRICGPEAEARVAAIEAGN